MHNRRILASNSMILTNEAYGTAAYGMWPAEQVSNSWKQYLLVVGKMRLPWNVDDRFGFDRRSGNRSSLGLLDARGSLGASRDLPNSGAAWTVSDPQCSASSSIKQDWHLFATTISPMVTLVERQPTAAQKASNVSEIERACPSLQAVRLNVHSRECDLSQCGSACWSALPKI